jgi:hypothetical protein
VFGLLPAAAIGTAQLQQLRLRGSDGFVACATAATGAAACFGFRRAKILAGAHHQQDRRSQDDRGDNQVLNEEGLEHAFDYNSYPAQPASVVLFSKINFDFTDAGSVGYAYVTQRMINGSMVL